MADDADLAAIRAFAAGGGRFETDKDGNIVAPINAQPEPTPDATQPTPPGAQADDRSRQPQRPARKPTTRGPLRGMVNWIENIPTPGGNLALVLILVFFAFAIIPVNHGMTRLQLIWAVLTGNASLPATGTGSAESAIGSIGAAAGQVGSTVAPFIPLIPSIGTLIPFAQTTSNATPAASGAGPVYLNDPTTLLEAPRGGDW